MIDTDDDYETSDGDSARRSLEDARRQPRLDLSHWKGPTKAILKTKLIWAFQCKYCNA